MVYHFDVHTLEYNLIDIYLMLFDMMYSCTTPVARISGTPIICADNVTLLISSDIDWNQIWYRVTQKDIEFNFILSISLFIYTPCIQYTTTHVVLLRSIFSSHVILFVLLVWFTQSIVLISALQMKSDQFMPHGIWNNMCCTTPVSRISCTPIICTDPVILFTFGGLN